MRTIFVMGEPVGKPRMTKRDVWAKRPIVLKYRAWADAARYAATGDAQGKINDPSIVGVLATFWLPVKESWSESKKAQWYGLLHAGRPDTDNMVKAVCDALFEQDWKLAAILGVKRYCPRLVKPHTIITLATESDLDTLNRLCIMANPAGVPPEAYGDHDEGHSQDAGSAGAHAVPAEAGDRDRPEGAAGAPA